MTNKINQSIFAEKKVGCSGALWSLVLSGKRNLEYYKAKNAARALKTKIDLWTSRVEDVNQRREVWADFILKVKK
jgi:hypothetical protein